MTSFFANKPCHSFHQTILLSQQSLSDMVRTMKLLLLLTFLSAGWKCAAFMHPRPVLRGAPLVSWRVPGSPCLNGCGTRDTMFETPRRTIIFSSPSEEISDGEYKQEKAGLRKRFSSYIKGGGTDDGLTFKQRLGKMGLATVLSYGWISNANAMILVAAAWYVFSVQVCYHCLLFK